MRSCFFVALLLGTLCFAGCGGQKTPDGMPELYPFTITVLQDDKPLEGAHIVLQSDTVSYGVSGLTDSSGKAEMKTGQYSGIPAAEYRAAVDKVVKTPSQYGNVCPPTPEGQAEWTANRKSEYRPTHSYVDAKYGDTATSELTVSVTGKGEATLNVGAAVDDITIPDDSASEPTDGAPAEAPVEE